MHDLSLGPYPEVSLAQAYLGAAEHRGLLQGGRGPVVERRMNKVTVGIDKDRAFRAAIM